MCQIGDPSWVKDKNVANVFTRLEIHVYWQFFHFHILLNLWAVEFRFFLVPPSSRESCVAHVSKNIAPEVMTLSMNIHYHMKMCIWLLLVLASISASFRHCRHCWLCKNWSLPKIKLVKCTILKWFDLVMKLYTDIYHHIKTCFCTKLST